MLTTSIVVCPQPNRCEVLIANGYEFIPTALTTNGKKLSPLWENSLPTNQENPWILWNVMLQKSLSLVHILS